MSRSSARWGGADGQFVHLSHILQRQRLPSAHRIVLVLVGPTASGKTEVSLHIARRMRCEIISADSRQVYRYLDIGTGKPSREQRERVRHHFVDELKPDEEFNAGEFGVRGREAVDAILQRGKLPVVVGGSGLYIRSLLDGLFEGPGADKEYRAALELQAKQGRVDDLLDKLRLVDPVTAAKLDRSRIPRIVRALEVYHLTGVPLSEIHARNKFNINFRSVMFGLEWNRAELYGRINRRCDDMIAGGLLKEVERLEIMGYSPGLNALNTVGYAEAFAYRRGEISFEEMIRLFKQNTRRYAKRQLTWFRRDGRIRWIRVTSERTSGSIADEIIEVFKKEAQLRPGR